MAYQTLMIIHPQWLFNAKAPQLTEATEHVDYISAEQ